MSQIIETNSSLLEEAVRALHHELILKESGFYSTVRACARLLDLSPSTLLDSHILKNGTPSGVLHKLFRCSVDELPESLKPLHGFDYRRCEALQTPKGVMKLLPEYVIMGLIRHYGSDARHKTKKAGILLAAFETVGLRVFLQKVYSRILLEESIMSNKSLHVEASVIANEKVESTPVEKLSDLMDRLERMGLSSVHISAILRKNIA